MDQWVEHVGNEPRYKKGEKYPAQSLQKRQQADDNQDADGSTDKAVKRDFLAFHRGWGLFRLVVTLAVLFDSLQVTGAAEWFILVRLAQHHLFVILHRAV